MALIGNDQIGALVGYIAGDGLHYWQRIAGLGQTVQNRADLHVAEARVIVRDSVDNGPADRASFFEHAQAYELGPIAKQRVQNGAVADFERAVLNRAFLK